MMEPSGRNGHGRVPATIRFDTDAQVSQVFVELTQIALLFHAVCQPQNKQSFRENN